MARRSSPRPAEPSLWSAARFRASLSTWVWRKPQGHLAFLTRDTLEQMVDRVRSFQDDPGHAMGLLYLARGYAKAGDTNAAGYLALLFLFTQRNPTRSFADPEGPYSLARLLPPAGQWPQDMQAHRKRCLALWGRCEPRKLCTQRLVLSRYGP